ncbi:MAG: hypothetical protein A3A73_05400 [Omnitrophica bacterium RIFCSPLOWO2_01_FULL_50_24]|nr:MAG: hypothetical protein A3A73_05400 [Omnitrophica bacterium RIFCSPLOWO2_01_FULL_50_24]
MPELFSQGKGSLKGNVRSQAHGIHPPKPLIFFSEKLKREIEKVWRLEGVPFCYLFGVTDGVRFSAICLVQFNSVTSD